MTVANNKHISVGYPSEDVYIHTVCDVSIEMPR